MRDEEGENFILYDQVTGDGSYWQRWPESLADGNKRGLPIFSLINDHSRHNDRPFDDGLPVGRDI